MERVFAVEEEWMEEIDCALIKTHREEHARVLSALHYVHARVKGRDFFLGRQVTNQLLPQWLVFHATTMDAALAIEMSMAERDAKHSGATVSYAHFN